MWALEVDINLLNQHRKPADWLADWLTDWLKHLGTQGTEGTRDLERLRQSKGTRALKVLQEHVDSPALRALWALGHSKGTWTLKTLVHLDTRGTRTLEGHLGTQAL